MARNRILTEMSGERGNLGTSRRDKTRDPNTENRLKSVRARKKEQEKTTVTESK